MENEGEEVQVEAEAAPVVEAETQPEVAEQEAPAETQPGEPERIEASADEARQNNYIPYDRFKSVVEERNDMRSKLEEQQRVLSMFRPGIQQQEQRSEPERAEPESYYDREDPGQVALNKLNQLEARMQADRQAADIERQVTKHVQDMGFADTDRAAQRIHKEIVWSLNTTGNLPDLEQVARDLRQEEIELTRRVVRGYEEKKNSPSARAAAPRPPSPPVVQTAEPTAFEGVGSKSALDRMMGALRGNR